MNVQVNCLSIIHPKSLEVAPLPPPSHPHGPLVLVPTSISPGPTLSLGRAAELVVYRSLYGTARGTRQGISCWGGPQTRIGSGCSCQDASEGEQPRYHPASPTPRRPSALLDLDSSTLPAPRVLPTPGHRGLRLRNAAARSAWRAGAPLFPSPLLPPGEANALFKVSPCLAAFEIWELNTN